MGGADKKLDPEVLERSDQMYSATQKKQVLGIHYNSLYSWISEYEKYGESAFPRKGTAPYSFQFEIKKLLKENADLKKELELLKKSHAFLKLKNV